MVTMVIRPWREVESTLHSDDVKNEWSYTPTPPICFHSVNRQKVILKLVQRYNCCSPIIIRIETIAFSSLNCLLMLHFNPLKPELNPICYLLALLAHHFLHVSRIRVKSLTLR